MNWADGSLPFYFAGIRDAFSCFAGKIIQQLQHLPKAENVQGLPALPKADKNGQYP